MGNLANWVVSQIEIAEETSQRSLRYKKSNIPDDYTSVGPFSYFVKIVIKFKKVR